MVHVLEPGKHLSDVVFCLVERHEGVVIGMPVQLCLERSSCKKLQERVSVSFEPLR